MELTEEQKGRVRLGEYASGLLSRGDRLCHASTRSGKQGRVVGVEQRVCWGRQQQVDEALAQVRQRRRSTPATWSGMHGTQRHFNARKARKVYTFSKELVFHVAVTWLCVVVLQLWLDAPHTAGASPRGPAPVSLPDARNGGRPHGSLLVPGKPADLSVVPTTTTTDQPK